MKKSIYTNEYKLFLELLIEARKSKNISQDGLAQKLNKPQSFVSKYENGERRIDVIELIHILQHLELEPIKFFKELNKRIDFENSSY